MTLWFAALDEAYSEGTSQGYLLEATGVCSAGLFMAMAMCMKLTGLVCAPGRGA